MRKLRISCTCVFRAAVFLSVILQMLGCATGSGVNRYEFFKSEASQKVNCSVEVPEASQGYESAGIMKNAFTTGFLIGGLVGATLVSSQPFTGLLRGKYAAGQAFFEVSQSICLGGRDAKTLRLELLRFQQYNVPGLALGLQAFMEFRATAGEPPQSNVSAYACDWKGRDAILSPNQEKNMLREMIEFSLNHWTGTWSKASDQTSGVFPKAERGSFDGDGVTCQYEIFVER